MSHEFGVLGDGVERNLAALAVADHDAGTDTFDRRPETRLHDLRRRGPAGHRLAGEGDACVDGELHAGEGRLAGEILRAAKAEQRPRLFHRPLDRRPLPLIRQRTPTRAPAFHVVDDVCRETGFEEALQPAGPSVRGRLPIGAGHSAAVNQQNGQVVPQWLRDEVLHIGLLDMVSAVRIQFGAGLRCEMDDFLRGARNPDLASADVETAESL